MRRPILAGNWKMNMTIAEATDFVRSIRRGLNDVKTVDRVLCPPFTALAALKELLAATEIGLGAQNMHWEEKGAFTGAVSPLMLEGLCDYVIIGHSERREYYGDTDELVARKFEAAQEHGLVPILCVGESLEEREGGTTEAVVERQLDAVLEQHGIEAFKNAVIAYEPVWAIGTGKTATPEQAQEVHKFIRDKLAALDAAVAEGCRLLYGGSMKPDNAAELISQPDIDGGLIGGASLKAEDFLGICAAAS